MRDRITVDPRIHFGKPCVAGTRIPVQSVLELVLDGESAADIVRDFYPELIADDIRACVQCAHLRPAEPDLRDTADER